MNPEINLLKKEMDSWIKDLQPKLSDIPKISEAIQNHSEDISFNYELIQELKLEINRLREEISALRLIQILQLKQDIKKLKEV